MAECRSLSLLFSPRSYYARYLVKLSLWYRVGLGRYTWYYSDVWPCKSSTCSTRIWAAHASYRPHCLRVQTYMYWLATHDVLHKLSSLRYDIKETVFVSRWSWFNLSLSNWLTLLCMICQAVVTAANRYTVQIDEAWQNKGIQSFTVFGQSKTAFGSLRRPELRIVSSKQRKRYTMDSVARKNQIANVT